MPALPGVRVKGAGMKEIFGFEGGFTAACSRVFDLMILGFLWILCSLPIVTVGTSSAALYYATVKSVKNRNGYAVQEFFRSFRRNLVPGIVLWLIILAVSVILRLNIGILTAKTSGYVGLFFICLYTAAAVYVGMAACYLFPALSRFDMSAGWLLKLSLYMVARYILTTLALALVLVCMGAFAYRIPILIFFVPGPIAFLFSEFLERVLKKHEPSDSFLEENTEK